MRAWTMLIAASWATGCAVYNDQCQPLVEDPSARVAFLKTELYLDRPNARHGNNAIGQQEADAFRWVFSQTDRPVDFAVVNGGGLRAEGLCVTRNILPPGPLTSGVLHEILLFENPVQAIDVSEEEVVAMFEHSVERLFTDPAPIVSPSGQFLQVSEGVHLEIDCARAPGDRVTALTLNGEALQKPGRPFGQKHFRLATSSYLIGGGDGYAMLAGRGTDPTRNPGTAQRFGGIDSNITQGYLQQSPFNVSQAQGLTVDAERIVFTHCSQPTRPSN